MQDRLIRTAAVFGCFLFIIIVIGNVVIVAQDSVSGTWTADAQPKFKKNGEPRENDIQLNFERTRERGHSQHGQGYKFSDLNGLTREQTSSGKVRFSLVREAGTVDCEGTFTDGRGSGTFTFTPNKGFFDGMRSRGFDFSKASDHGSSIEDRAFTAAMINVTTAIADDILSANFGPLDIDDLFKAAIFKIDGKFMAEMKASGFPNLKMEDLVKARIFKIDADYVRQIHEMGLDNRDFEQLVKFRIFKVTPEFLGELKSAGLADMDAEDIVKCRIFKIDADFVRKAKAEDANVTIEDLVKMKIGVYRRKSEI